jgi:hypothetical protein
VKDATEVVVVQQCGLSLQKFPGETERRQAGFRKRVLTFRPSLAVPLVLAYLSVVAEVSSVSVTLHAVRGVCQCAYREGSSFTGPTATLTVPFRARCM